jgi:hypothetical protein
LKEKNKSEEKQIFIHLLIRIAPRASELEIHDMLGLHNSMDTFVGRQKKSN